MNENIFFKDIIRTVIGADQLFDTLLKPISFPKYEIVKSEKTNKTFLKVLLAGYKKEDIKITTNPGVLNISHDKADNEESDESLVYLTDKVIARRAFKIQFRIAPNFKVENANFQDGILTITFEEDRVASPHEVTIE